jgi:hypothetical protein
MSAAVQATAALRVIALKVSDPEAPKVLRTLSLIVAPLVRVKASVDWEQVIVTVRTNCDD